MTIDAADRFNPPAISIHIPRVGDDVTALDNVNTALIFQSTSPVWGMTAIQSVRNRKL